ncbi:MAG: hypothetical protein M1838_005046 [Thelocarpon superellum]|nr:MAG: hypothetical protein M1838_005046 [Thelocarpon superellum]
MRVKDTGSISIRLLTHNIRYATESPFKGEVPWRDRRSLLCNNLIFNTRHNPEALICLQEVLHDQLLDIRRALDGTPHGQDPPSSSSASSSSVPPSSSSALPADLLAPRPAWAYIGVGREDGHERGEYAPIFYRPSVWSVQHFETIWLSETPDRPSRGWDAASIRILTVGIFQHRASHRHVVVFNTHLDDQGTRSRTEAAKVIMRAAERFADPDYVLIPPPPPPPPGHPRSTLTFPVLLAGDLNSPEGQGAHGLLNAPRSPVQDVRELVDGRLVAGEHYTFTGFKGGPDPPSVIDFLFLGPREQTRDRGLLLHGEMAAPPPWLVTSYVVLPNRAADCPVYMSDHRAVVADLVLR